MGVNVNKWRNQLWTCIHYIALNYPDNPSDEDKINYKNFFMSLKDILPCNICKEHYEDILLILPLTNDSLNNRTTLFKWTVDLHNKVNILNDKPFFSSEDAKFDLLSFPASGCPRCSGRPRQPTIALAAHASMKIPMIFRKP